jgi:hypothetical protein
MGFPAQRAIRFLRPKGMLTGARDEYGDAFWRGHHEETESEVSAVFNRSDGLEVKGERRLLRREASETL